MSHSMAGTECERWAGDIPKQSQIKRGIDLIPRSRRFTGNVHFRGEYLNRSPG